MAEKRKMHRVLDVNGNLVQILPETVGEQVKITDSGNNYNSGDVEGALSEIAQELRELESSISSAGKVDDVLDVNGNSVVSNKIAQLSKAAVGLENVENTADSQKVVKEAGKVANKLKIGGSTINIQYDGSVPLAATFKDDDFGVVYDAANGGVAISVKDKFVKKAGDTITGDLTIGGNLTVQGSTSTIESENLKVSDKLIEVAKDNTNPLTSPAGIVVPKYDGTNYGALVFDGTGTAYVGDVALKDDNIDVDSSDLQAIATRDSLVDDKLVKWDDTKKTLVTENKNYAQKDVSEEITGEWFFTNENGIKTDKIENINGNNVYEFDGANSKFGATSVPTQILGSGDRPKYSKDATTYKEIALKDDIAGTTVDDAKNVTSTIGGRAISDIFENNSNTVKKASLSETANAANKVANALTISGQNANGTDKSKSYNGSAPVEVAYEEADFNTEVSDSVVSVELANSGVTAGTYSAVVVDTKGRAIAGGRSIEFGVAGQTEPSEDLMIGGLFFELVGD